MKSNNNIQLCKHGSFKNLCSRCQHGHSAQMKVVKQKGNYVCHICGNSFDWNKESSWYGSLAQMDEDPDSVPYFCSKICSDKFDKKNTKHEKP